MNQKSNFEKRQKMIINQILHYYFNTQRLLIQYRNTNNISQYYKILTLKNKISAMGT